jgi:hypothetical protein
MGKNGVWERSSSGPDWMDIRTMLIAVGTLHSATVEVTLSPDGTGSTGGLKVELAAHFERLPGSALPESVIENVIWPNKDSRTVEGAVYNLIWKLDYAISKVYKNEELWK